MSLTGTDAEARPAARDASWPRTTRAEELRLQLADEIVRGVHAPGAPLDETRIANRFNVSRTPVREAIRLLAASGLVEVRPHRAALVPHLESVPDQRESMARNNAWLQAGYLIVALRAVGVAAGPMGGMDAAGLDADLLAGTGWTSFLVVNVGQADGARYLFPRAARLGWGQATRTV